MLTAVQVAGVPLFDTTSPVRSPYTLVFTMVFIKSFAAVALFSYLAVAAPVRREVPQEHSHEPILTAVRATLNLNNPDKIQDPVFALLGDAAAAAGAGNIKVTSFVLRSHVARSYVAPHSEPRLLATSRRRPGVHERQGCWRR